MEGAEQQLESTLESEIDALSKIITDTRGASPELAGSARDFKLDSGDVSFDQQCGSEQDDDLALKDILDGSSELDSFISATDSSFKTAPNVTLKINETKYLNDEVSDSELQDQDLDSKTVEPEVDTTSQDSPNESTIDAETLNANNSLSLISEAYTSQESQSCTDSPLATVTENQLESIPEEKNTESDADKLLEDVSSKDTNVSKNVGSLSENKEASETEQKETGSLELLETIENQDQSAKDCDENDFSSNISVPRLESEIKDELSKENSNSQTAKSKEDIKDVLDEELLDDSKVDSKLESIAEQNLIDDPLESTSDRMIVDNQQQKETSTSNLTCKTDTSEDNKNPDIVSSDADFKDALGIEAHVDTSSENINDSAENPQSSLTDADFEPYEDTIDSDNNIEMLQDENESKEDADLSDVLPEQLLINEKEVERQVNEDAEENHDKLKLNDPIDDLLNSNKSEDQESSQLLKETKDNPIVDSVNIVKNNDESISEVSDDVVKHSDPTVETQVESTEKQKERINCPGDSTKSSEKSNDKNILPDIESVEGGKLLLDAETSSTEPVSEEINIEPLENKEDTTNKDSEENINDLAESKSTNIEESEVISEIEQKEKTINCSDPLNINESIENVNEASAEVTSEPMSVDQITQSEKIEGKEQIIIENESLENIENIKNVSDNIINCEKPQVTELASDQVPDGTVNVENPSNVLTDSDFEPYEENMESDKDTTISQDRSKENFEILDNSAESESIIFNIDSEAKSEPEQENKTEDPLANIPSSQTEEEDDVQEMFNFVEENKDEVKTNNSTDDSIKDENLEESEESKQLIESKTIKDLNLQEHTEDKNDITFENITECNDKSSKNNLAREETEENLLLKCDSKLNETEARTEVNSTENEAVDEPEVTETSESERAVKFLQEFEQNIETAKVEENMTITEENSSVFVSVEDSICDSASDVAPEAVVDPIAISEAEIISEAVKLESEKRRRLELEEEQKHAEVEESCDGSAADKSPLYVTGDLENIDASNSEMDEAKEIQQIPIAPEILMMSKSLPKTSVLEDRYKEPPKIDIPEASPQIIDLPSDALKTSLAVEEEAPKQRSDSPERQTVSSEPKITDTPRKDSDKHQQQQHQQFSECENVGSPRIILKIAKSAIADCSEPRSPKSPKIRSAANSPNPEDSPSHKLGKIKLKLSKGGHPSIIPSSDSGYDESVQWHTETSSTLSAHGSMKIKLAKTSEVDKDEEEVKEKSSAHKQKYKEPKEANVQEATVPKKQDSLGMKIKLSKSGDASIIQDNKSSDDHKEARVKDKAVEDIQEGTRRTESPLGMKIKLSKSGDASIISNDSERLDADEASKAKIPKEAELSSEVADETVRAGKTMKIKLTKTGEASVVHSKKDDEVTKKATEQPLGMMKIKLSKTGEPSIIHSEVPKETKHSKNKDHSVAGQQKSKDDSHLEMKIKLSKTGHPTIITSSESQEEPSKTPSIAQSTKQKDLLSFKESTLKELKRSHTDVTIEPVVGPSAENTMVDLHSKRKEITISPVESKKAKMDANLKQMLPDITIHSINAPKKEQSQQKLMLDSKSGNISLQQMNVINQEISITQVCSVSSGSNLMNDEIKTMHNQGILQSQLNSDCEIVNPQPELIIVNENSSSSQDIMIIDEVPSLKSTVKVPKKRGRPRRNAVPVPTTPTMSQPFQNLEFSRDPLSLEQPGLMLQQHLPMQALPQIQQPQQMMPQIVPGSVKGTEAGRPRRTCRSQKSYAPPKRGRGRGRGKRKNEALDIPMKKQRIEQDLTEIEKSTTAIIALEKLPLTVSSKSPELFKALSQPMLSRVDTQPSDVELIAAPSSKQSASNCEAIEFSSQAMQDVVGRKSDVVIKVTNEDEKQSEIVDSAKDSMVIQEHQNWLAPSIKKVSSESSTPMVSKNESISTLTVIDEETRMSAESGSRSQTPARSVPVPGGPEALAANEESQGSVLSTATTESEKVKVKSRRMEINLDPDEGPFTVEKIAEYEWPQERKDDRPAVRGETFMIQEQISQYLGVKSFKRKYPDLKRRMVDMEERNFLREHGLVSEAMCDMGLTAVSSSEVLDIMCSDFPEQYEEYRKHLREKAAKEHSKKQKELSAAANAERSRIDLAEMAVQSALAWNAGLNKARRDARKCSLDLQTFTVHVPLRRGLQRPEQPSRRHSNSYPVALMPGQYAEYFREYTPAELRYYPLNTVLYGPMRPNERKFDSQSEGSQSDSDSDSSSDDSSSSSSEGTQDTEGSQSTMDEVDMELAMQSDVKCKICSNNLNKSNRPEVLVQCGTCSGNVHPSCIDLTLDMVPHIRAYAWQCADCKTCAQCHDPADEDKMLFCDMCDRGYHIYCVGLRRVPQGRWHCQECAVCANCGSKEPGGANSDRNSVAQWQHEYKKAEKNTRVYVSTFCVPCSKLRGNQGSDNRQEKLFV